MNTSEIKEFAINQYKALLVNGALEESNWIAFGAEWNLEIWLPEWDEDSVRVSVYPTIDGQIELIDVYTFTFPRSNTKDFEKWAAWLDDDDENVVKFYVPVYPPVNIVEEAALVLGIDVCAEINVERVS